MRFTKMHGAGNDYVYVDCFAEDPPRDIPELARKISDRHTGVGADGLILLGPSESADARMRIWNADGSEAEMCGNGLRCVAKYVYDHGIVRKEKLKIESGKGILDVQLEVTAGKATMARVNMGPPILQSVKIPTSLPGDPPINVPLAVAAHEIEVTCLSMGNPHCVVFVDDLTDEWVLGMGAEIEQHLAFPNRVNAEFVKVLSPTEIQLRVWERGTGETRACGSGACAAGVAGVLTGRLERNVLARLPGGELQLEWSNSGDVLLTGPAVEVFSGEWRECPH